MPTWAEPLKFALGIPIGEFLFNKAVSGLTRFVADQAELMFDQPIANAAFDWVLTSVQTANSSNPKLSLLLPKPAAHYRGVWNQDGTVSRRGVYSKDAYDKIAESVVVGALSSLPGGGVIPVIVAKQVRDAEDVAAHYLLCRQRALDEARISSALLTLRTPASAMHCLCDFRLFTMQTMRKTICSGR